MRAPVIVGVLDWGDVGQVRPFKQKRIGEPYWQNIASLWSVSGNLVNLGEMECFLQRVFGTTLTCSPRLG